MYGIRLYRDLLCVDENRMLVKSIDGAREWTREDGRKTGPEKIFAEFGGGFGGGICAGARGDYER